MFKLKEVLLIDTEQTKIRNTCIKNLSTRLVLLFVNKADFSDLLLIPLFSPLKVQTLPITSRLRCTHSSLNNNISKIYTKYIFLDQNLCHFNYYYKIEIKITRNRMKYTSHKNLLFFLVTNFLFKTCKAFVI